MSGFFGMVREDGVLVEERLLQRVAQELSLRGPGEPNAWARANVGGCFTWMRTGPAPQASHQPVVWEDRFWLWGDVRLDARQELLALLGGEEGAQTQGAASEELLLRFWAKWGAGCLERIIGDFSFALWDAKEGCLWCARDFVGARPFYYAQAQGAFCFSNTLPVLPLVPEISADLDERFLGDFLLRGWSADPARTVYRDIKRLPPGHLLHFAKGNLQIRRFRKLPIEEPLRLSHPEEYLEAYHDLLRAAVQDRLPEGPTALYLSGGLDSSSVSAIASQIAGERGQKEKLKAFTLSWAPFHDDPEPAVASLTARHLGIEHEVLEESQLKPFEAAGSVEGGVPEPDDEIFFARERRNARKIAAHSHVVLAGDGGDDILTGQAWPYLVDLWHKREWKRIAVDFGGYVWSKKRIPPLRGGFRSRLRKLTRPEDPLEGFPDWLNDHFAARLNLKQRWLELANRERTYEHPLHPIAYESLHSGYWGSVLEMEDAGWRRVPLETRAPLLDLRMLAFLLRLPPVPWCMNKELCRQAMRNILPPTILQRPKTPLLHDSMLNLWEAGDWVAGLPKNPPGGKMGEFVNWSKWCETLYRSKGSLSWIVLRPVSLLHWLKAVENR